MVKSDDLAKKVVIPALFVVIPAQAGIQREWNFYEFIKDKALNT